MRFTPETWEQRHAYRIGTPGARAICRGPAFIAQCDVANMSMSGALLRSGDTRPVGESVSLEVATPGRGVLEVSGRVAWEDRLRGSMAVCFDSLEPSGEDTIQDLVLDALERARR